MIYHAWVTVESLKNTYRIIGVKEQQREIEAGLQAAAGGQRKAQPEDSEGTGEGKGDTFYTAFKKCRSILRFGPTAAAVPAEEENPGPGFLRLPKCARLRSVICIPMSPAPCPSPCDSCTLCLSKGSRCPRKGCSPSGRLWVCGLVVRHPAMGPRARHCFCLASATGDGSLRCFNSL